MPGRKIGIRFPEDHPIWRYPPDKRSSILRDQIEINAIYEQLKECLQRIAVIEAKLDKILDKVANVHVFEEKPNNRSSDGSTIDPEDVAEQVLGFLDEF